MSRAFHPPDTLTDEDRKTIADVRRDIWTAGFTGLGYGSATVIGLYATASVGNYWKIWKIPVNRNTALLSFLLCGAMGSYFMSMNVGKKEVHNLHPIYERGSRKHLLPPVLAPPGSYLEALQLAKERYNSEQQQQQQQQSDDQPLVKDHENKPKVGTGMIESAFIDDITQFRKG